MGSNGTTKGTAKRLRRDHRLVAGQAGSRRAFGLMRERLSKSRRRSERRNARAVAQIRADAHPRDAEVPDGAGPRITSITPRSWYARAPRRRQLGERRHHSKELWARLSGPKRTEIPRSPKTRVGALAGAKRNRAGEVQLQRGRSRDRTLRSGGRSRHRTSRVRARGTFIGFIRMHCGTALRHTSHDHRLPGSRESASRCSAPAPRRSTTPPRRSNMARAEVPTCYSGQAPGET